VLQDVAESLVTTVVPTITPFFRLGSTCRCDDTPFISLNRYFAFTTSWLPSCMGVLSNLVVQTSRRYWYISKKDPVRIILYMCHLGHLWLVHRQPNPSDVELSGLVTISIGLLHAVVSSLWSFICHALFFFFSFFLALRLFIKGTLKKPCSIQQIIIIISKIRYLSLM
jgi:hypothetical protein